MSDHRLSIGWAAACCALTLAACGSTTKSPSASAGGPPKLVQYSACMRSHGVSGFPDPSTTETPNSFGIDGYNFDLPATLSTQSPAYVSAQKTCGGLIGSGSGGPRNPAFLAKAKQAALAHAQCMREHGVPNFPDPTFSGAGGAVTVSSGGSGMNPQSPAFQRAQKLCQHT